MPPRVLSFDLLSCVDCPVGPWPRGKALLVDGLSLDESFSLVGKTRCSPHVVDLYQNYMVPLLVGFKGGLDYLTSDVVGPNSRHFSTNFDGFRLEIEMFFYDCLWLKSTIFRPVPGTFDVASKSWIEICHIIILFLSASVKLFDRTGLKLSLIGFHPKRRTYTLKYKSAGPNSS